MADGGSEITKLSLVVASGTFEKVHYAFVIATGAAAIDIPVTMFFTNAACPAVLDGAGWHDLVSEVDGMSALTRDEDFAEKGVATMDELIDSAAELGVRFMVCEMGMRAEGLEGRATRPGLEITRGGVVTFFNDAEKDGQIIYI